jgi:hypothetical protein
MKRASIVLALGVTLGLGGCDRVFSDLVIKNDSSRRVTDIVIKYEEWSSQLGDLEPGSQITFNGHISGEGAPMIFYTIRNKRLSYETCYYTGGSPARGEVTIRDDGATRICY